MPCIHPQPVAVAAAPDPDRAVDAAGCDQFAVGRKRHGEHRPVVTEQRLEGFAPREIPELDRLVDRRGHAGAAVRRQVERGDAEIVRLKCAELDAVRDLPCMNAAI
jgi:hypothetical protein